MSTQHHVRVAARCAATAALLAPCALLVACADRPAPPRTVDYGGLDRPRTEEPAVAVVAVLADTTGPGADAGRAAVEAVRSAFRVESWLACPGVSRTARVQALDDRGTPDGLAASAARLAVDPGAHVAIVVAGPGRFLRVVEGAPRTVAVCGGCDPADARREGAFVLAGPGGAEGGAAAARWIRCALQGAGAALSPREAAVRLRATEPPQGYVAHEGTEPAADPAAFRAPSTPGPR